MDGKKFSPHEIRNGDTISFSPSNASTGNNASCSESLGPFQIKKEGPDIRNQFHDEVDTSHLKFQ